MKELIDITQSKEFLLIILAQVISSLPNDQELGKFIRKNFKDYLTEE